MVDVFAFSLYQEDRVLDNQPVMDASFTDLMPVKYFEEIAQSEADGLIKNIRKTSCDHKLCNFRPANDATLANAFRQWYSEMRLADMIERVKSEYDYGIVVGPDFYVFNTLDINNIEQILDQELPVVAVSDQKSSGTYKVPNGFYVAKPENLVKMLSTYYSLPEILSGASKSGYSINYEESIEQNANLQQLLLYKIPFAYTKIRNNTGFKRLQFMRFENLNNKSDLLQRELIQNAKAMCRRYPELFFISFRSFH